jgi:hypothetical protein
MEDSTSKDSSDEGEHDIIDETEELRRKSLEQLQEGELISTLSHTIPYYCTAGVPL